MFVVNNPNKYNTKNKKGEEQYFHISIQYFNATHFYFADIMLTYIAKRKLKLYFEISYSKTRTVIKYYVLF